MTSADSPDRPAPNWRRIAGVALLVVALICAVVLIAGAGSGTDGDGNVRPFTDSSRGSSEAVQAVHDALSALDDTSAEVVASLTYTALSEISDTPPPGVPPEHHSIALAIEEGAVDFKTGAALGGTGEGVVPPSISVEGTTYLDFTDSPLSSFLHVEGWVAAGPETMIGVDSNSSTLRTLLDVVGTRDVWVGDTGEVVADGTYVVAIDEAALSQRDQERLEVLGDPLAGLIEDEFAAGRRSTPGQFLQVTVGDDGLPTEIRLEVVAGGEVATLIWELDNFGVEVDVAGLIPSAPTPYSEYSEGLAAALHPYATGEGSEVSPSDLEEFYGAGADQPDATEGGN